MISRVSPSAASVPFRVGDLIEWKGPFRNAWQSATADEDAWVVFDRKDGQPKPHILVLEMFGLEDATGYEAETTIVVYGFCTGVVVKRSSTYWGDWRIVARGGAE